ncbi:unnamed protein product [Hyaloperonospora brassicae]|uniref:N-acetylglucosaminylphosphatidylinositol deacetylase n=1 Tax=Hyaloperonospora brassicae TaxID=162125 RepID=A0AAV0TRZ2_HYABA|nr:unnamed protein product [Hyaloperonospora brassicae]
MLFDLNDEEFQTRLEAPKHLLLGANVLLGPSESRNFARVPATLDWQLPHVHVLEEPELQDGMQNHWDTSRIAAIVLDYVDKHRIDAVFTFDGYGVSGASKPHCDPLRIFSRYTFVNTFRPLLEVDVTDRPLAHKKTQ